MRNLTGSAIFWRYILMTKEERRKKRRIRRIRNMLLCLLMLVGACAALFFGIRWIHAWAESRSMEPAAVWDSMEESSWEESQKEENSTLPSAQENSDQEESSAGAAPEQELFAPRAAETTRPSEYIASTRIRRDGKDLSHYYNPHPSVFRGWEEYAQADGIFAFRGNHFRNTASYGSVQMTKREFDAAKSWVYEIGCLEAPDEVCWTGTGWTGQPLMRKWSQEQKRHMNMYEWAAEQEDLVEVIYAALDGYIYFLDLDTGEPTRDALWLGYTFKGSGSLDPRGYPILYVGSGYDGFEGDSRAFIINLQDCSVMYTFGNGDDLAPRCFSYFDSSPLVCAETDQLIYPGENGVLYLLTLNTQYDETSGMLSIDPSSFTQWTYKSSRWMWPGMEDSAVIYGHYLFIADNGGNFFCLDLTTLSLVWVQDVFDDTNCTPVLEIEEDGHAYLYISTSYHEDWRGTEEETAEIPIWKVDALTGEIVWSVSYDCWTIEELSGGVQGTIALGQGSLSEYIYVPVARTPDVMSGVLAAVRKSDGKVVWEVPSAYSWSSPVCIYDQNGKGYVINANFDGDLLLIDGLSGEVLDTMNVGSNVESSPAVYENRLVVGTRGQQIWGISFQ